MPMQHLLIEDHDWHVVMFRALSPEEAFEEWQKNAYPAQLRY